MTIELCLSVIVAVTGIFGTAISILGVVNNRFLAIRQYMAGVEAPEFIKARNNIRQIKDSSLISVDSIEAAQLVNYFDHWGLLAKKHYLPLWVFNSGSGDGIIYYYGKVHAYILKRQKEEQITTYASNFHWLYKKLGGPEISNEDQLCNWGQSCNEDQSCNGDQSCN